MLLHDGLSSFEWHWLVIHSYTFLNCQKLVIEILCNHFHSSVFLYWGHMQQVEDFVCICTLFFLYQVMHLKLYFRVFGIEVGDYCAAYFLRSLFFKWSWSWFLISTTCLIFTLLPWFQLLDAYLHFLGNGAEILLPHQCDMIFEGAPVKKALMEKMKVSVSVFRKPLF